MVKAGYSEDFQITENGLELPGKHSNYTPDHINAINSFRFESQSARDDNATLYLIETDDGTRGTLIESHRVANDPRLTKFIKAVAGHNRKN